MYHEGNDPPRAQRRGAMVDEADAAIARVTPLSSEKFFAFVDAGLGGSHLITQIRCQRDDWRERRVVPPGTIRAVAATIARGRDKEVKNRSMREFGSLEAPKDPGAKIGRRS